MQKQIGRPICHRGIGLVVAALTSAAIQFLKKPGMLLNLQCCKISKGTLHEFNKPGTAQVGAISKAQKDSKTTFSTTGDNKSSQKTKN